MLKEKTYVALITGKLRSAGKPDIAEGQAAYMRNLYPFYGVKTPQLKAILREQFSEHGLYSGEQLKQYVRLCFDEEYREMHHAGLFMLERRLKTLAKADIAFLRELATTNSWWDTVDYIRKFVALHFQRFPELQHPVCRQWIEDDNIWLQRLALIHQLTYKDKTDWELMKELILRRGDSSEFFVQKGAGWALRAYTRVDPDAVIAFIRENDHLPALTKREGLKWLRDTGRL